jgi:hypothetical protein
VTPAAVLGLVALGGAVLALVSWWAVGRSGAMPGLGRRLAGPPEMKVGRLLDADELPGRPVRVSGRIRCPDPLLAEDDERLVCFHRDVEVLAGGHWRTLERLREARSFDLWDHDGSVPLDPALAAEPLVTIPKVWRGGPSALEEPHASAARRLAERHGAPTAARSTVRTVAVTDRLLVLAQPVREPDGRVRLAPPPGGFVITNLSLPDAMRVLGGRRRRLAAASVIGIGVGVAVAACAGVAAIAASVLGG